MSSSLQAAAFSPGHITGFFQICLDPASLLKSGSRGAGISLAKGVKTQVIAEPGDGEAYIFINDQPCSDAVVSKKVVELLKEKGVVSGKYDIYVHHAIGVPMGCGFGTSGAGALSLAFALNKAFSGGLSFDECVSVAHMAEVELRTGLGTVMGEAYGGIEIREAPGAPGYGKVSHIDYPEGLQVGCIIFGKLSTSELLSQDELKSRINRYGGNLVDELSRIRTLEAFRSFSRDFTINTGLLSPQLRTIIEELDAIGISASMLMFGEGLFVLEPASQMGRIMEIFYRFNAEVFISGIDNKGVRLT